MKSRFERDDLMTILDGMEDAVVKLDEYAKFAAMNQAAADIYQRLGMDPQNRKGNRSGNCFQNSKAPWSNGNYAE
jgi:hypothetical protein